MIDVSGLNPNTDFSVGYLMDMFESRYPELWAKCYPRRYNEPKCGRYYSPRIVAFDMASAVLKRDMASTPDEQKVASLEYWVACQLARFRVPIFYLSEELASAVKMTTPPIELAWYDMKLPFESAVFMLPKGALTHKLYGDVAYVSYARMKKDEILPSPFSGWSAYGSLNGCFTLMTSVEMPPDKYATKDRCVFHYNWALNMTPTIDLARLNTDMLLAWDDTNIELYKEGLTADDHTLQSLTAHYVFGTLLLMTTRPDLVKRGAMTKRVPPKAAGGPPREYWDPNIIGEQFKLRREYTPKGGTHASPRGHWVRGFYRDQHYGPKYSLIKNAWIEPFWRGGK